MQITQELPDFRYLCRGVSAGGVLVNERELRASFLLTPNQLVEDWALDALMAADDAHWQAILDLQPALFILGTGAVQTFPNPKQLAFFLQRGIGFETMNNAAAARTFNILAQEGRNVVAGFLIPR